MKRNNNIFHMFIFSALAIGTPLIQGCGPSGTPESCCGQKINAQKIADENKLAAASMVSGSKTAVVTFIELGSMNCVPCRMMQPVMDSIEKKYGSRVKVIFHDVMTPEGRPFAEKFGIRAIPTQVFLDTDGKEFFRHTGFFPEKDIVEILHGKGVNQ